VFIDTCTSTCSSGGSLHPAVLLGLFLKRVRGPSARMRWPSFRHGSLRPPLQVRDLSVSGCPVEHEGLIPLVKVLVVSGADPVHQNPASDLVKNAYEKIPFTVCADFILTDTARTSRLVLPITTLDQSFP